MYSILDKKNPEKGKKNHNIFNSRLVFIILTRSIKSKQKKSDFFFLTIFLYHGKELHPGNFCHKGLFWFSVTCDNGKKTSPHHNNLMLKLTVPYKPHLNIFL